MAAGSVCYNTSKHTLECRWGWVLSQNTTDPEESLKWPLQMGRAAPQFGWFSTHPTAFQTRSVMAAADPHNNGSLAGQGADWES